MEKEASPPPDRATVTTPNSPPPPLSPQSDHQNYHKHQEEFAASFASLYRSIFPTEEEEEGEEESSSLPLSLSPSPPSSSSSSSSSDFTTGHRLHHACLILEHSELQNHYDRCLNRLGNVTAEIEALRQENADLRLANAELLKLIRANRQQVSDFAVFEPPTRVERRSNLDRSFLPKSISVRSSGYLKLHQPRTGGNGGGPSRPASQLGVTSQLGCASVAQRVCVPAGGGKGEKDAVELEVYRQGMVKTELCNKWQETGACPYGNNCQFAHGVEELRPVIRHPRYKTEVCRMVIAGATCPYGHRCHFRHSLTEQERLLLPRS